MRAFHGDACTGGVRPKPPSKLLLRPARQEKLNTYPHSHNCAASRRAPIEEVGEPPMSRTAGAVVSEFFCVGSHPAQVRCLAFWGKVQSRSKPFAEHSPMPTLSKRPPTPPAKRRAASPPKPVAKPQRFLRFHHSEDLRIKTLALLTRPRTSSGSDQAPCCTRRVDSRVEWRWHRIATSCSPSNWQSQAFSSNRRRALAYPGA